MSIYALYNTCSSMNFLVTSSVMVWNATVKKSIYTIFKTTSLSRQPLVTF